MVDITPILEALVALVVAVIGVLVGELIKWLKTKVSADIVDIAVRAAEQMMLSGQIEAGERFDFALAQSKAALKKKRITFDEVAIKGAIESAVYDLNQEQG